ncbi:hypothetical protein Tco_0625918 [Tanacetum coccineum]|uniref:Uncharacterized protein n=1 Tax=Tanacetum coccineum TaxID=301880 RepID=A0ABQ4WI70_9ASTR
MGVVTPPEDLNVKFLRSLPSEWDTHVVVWMNKDTHGFGLNYDQYKHFKIVEQMVKNMLRFASNDDKKHGISNTVQGAKANVSTAIKWDILPGNAEHLGVSNRNWNQGSSTKTVKIEDASEKAMCAIDGAGFDWSDMAEEEIQANMALMAFSDSEYDDLLVKLSDTDFKAATYKREYELGLLRTELEKVKQEKEGVDFKIAKFDKSAKDLNEMLESQITDKSKKGVGYHAVPSPHPLILNRPTTLDLSYSGLKEFKEPEVNEYGPRDSSLKPTTGCDKESENSKENTDDSLEQHQMNDTETSSFETKKLRKNNDAPIIEDWVSDDEDKVESPVVVKKKTVIPTAAKIEKPVRKPVRYAEMYRSPRPRGNQRNWNGQKSNQLGCNFVFNNKACFICESFDHIQYSCPNQQRKRIVSGNNYNKKDNDYYSKTSHSSAHKHMAPRAVLMKTGLKSFNTARPVNTVRSVNTSRPFSTARSFSTVRPFYTAHPKSTIHCARPKTYFQNQAQSTVHRPFYKRTTLTKRCFNQRFNTGRPFRSTVNTVRARGFNAVKPSACWVWRPIKPNGASLVFNKYNYIDAQGRSNYYCWFKIIAVGETVNAAESLLVVSTEVNAN